MSRLRRTGVTRSAARRRSGRWRPSSPDQPAPRVVIADDQTLVRTGFGMILRDAGIPVVAEAADGVQAVAAVLEHHPDVVLMDIRMPEMDGLEATRRIFAAEPDSDCRIIILTTFDLDQYVYAALAAGASGFLLKHVSAEYLTAAIRMVRSGGRAAGPVDHAPPGGAVHAGQHGSPARPPRAVRPQP